MAPPVEPYSFSPASVAALSVCASMGLYSPEKYLIATIDSPCGDEYNPIVKDAGKSYHGCCHFAGVLYLLQSMDRWVFV